VLKTFAEGNKAPGQKGSEKNVSKIDDRSNFMYAPLKDQVNL
jgi:hypothetical protein